jgi:hypothetical protein
MVLEHFFSLSSVYKNAFTCRVKVVKFATMLFTIDLVVFPFFFFLFFKTVSSLLLVLGVRLRL